MKSVQVGTRSRRYRVVVHRNPWRLGRLPDKIYGDSGKVVVITESTVAEHYLHSALSRLRRLGLDPREIVVPPGEGTKTMATVTKVARSLVEYEAHRGTPIIALGGGVVGDLVGLVASLYMRGVPLFHMPTTLLAQVDSSVGGKTAVNLPEGKNLLGTFYQPERVWICPAFLRTLAPRRVREGLAEVLKYGYIRAPELLEQACALSVTDPCEDMDLLESIVLRSVQVKADVVTRDERESGERRILNFGHTLGHAVEAAMTYRGITHGEAVGIGMDLALGIGEMLGITESGLRADLRARLKRIGLPVDVPAGLEREQLVDLALMDKKRSAKGLRFVFVTEPGKTKVEELERAQLRSIMRRLA